CKVEGRMRSSDYGAESDDGRRVFAPPRVRIRGEEPAPPPQTRDALPADQVSPTVFDIRDMAVIYGSKTDLTDTTLEIHRNLVTAVIGPSGCGKSTFLRSLNRMN